jgi:amino acid transporter
MLFCGLVLFLFALGFTAMTKHVPNSGAFYAYALHGLGKGPGIGLALVTVVAYLFLNICFYAFIGFYGGALLDEFLGWHTPWWVCALLAAVLVTVLGARQIDVGAKVLAVLVTAEVAILLVIAIAVLVHGSPEPISFESFSPKAVLFGGGTSALLVLGFGAYLGFEGTAIYAEEARDPHRTVPKATYAVVIALAVFYAFTFWILTVAFGAKGVLSMAAGPKFEDMVMIAGENALGHWAYVVLSILIVTSFMACALSFHNATTRYVFSLARERLLPRKLADLGAVTQAPYRSSLLISAITIVFLAVCAPLVHDVYMGLALWTYAVGVQGLVFAQAMAAISVVVFFLRDRRGHTWWRSVIAPALGAVGLTIGFILIITHFDITSGMEGWINWVLIAPTPVLFVGGFVVSAVLKRRSRQTWEELGYQDETREEREEESVRAASGTTQATASGTKGDEDGSGRVDTYA